MEPDFTLDTWPKTDKAITPFTAIQKVSASEIHNSAKTSLTLQNFAGAIECRYSHQK